MPINKSKGQTLDGVLKTTSVDYQGTRDAIQGIWNEKNEGSMLYLSGQPIDLTQYENLVAIAVDMKFDKKPRRLTMSWRLDCGYPCSGTVDVGKNLAKKPNGEWFTFPVPLNCFSKSGADLSKIKSPFLLSTPNEVTLNIANVRLVLLPEGDKGCAR